MKNRNSLIKSITVTKRPITFELGEVYFTGRHGCMERHVVMGPPFLSEDLKIWKVPVLSKYLPDFGSKYSWRREDREPQEDFLYIGDEGVPGYTYDKRPCRLGRSEHTAHIAYEKYITWLNSSARWERE